MPSSTHPGRNPSRLAAWLIASVATLALCNPARALTTSPPAPPPGYYSVLDTGAKGDGKADDTAAIQAALDNAGKDSIGGIVTVPAGNYLIKGHLNIPSNVTLEGVWTIPTAWTQNQGTTFLAVEGEGKSDGPAFITLNTNSTLKGLTIFYPNQVAANPPKAYPWTVAAAGCDNPSILDVLLVNPYQAVDFGTHAAGRHLIRNLYGMPLYKGIFIDQCYDVGRIENVHFWPFWNPNDPEKNKELHQFISTQGEAFIFARTDWEYVTNTFSWGYRVGYHFTKSSSGYTNGNFLGIGADATETAVLVDECAPYGLLITNGEFVSFNGDDPTAVVVGEKNIGAVQFHNCSFWGPMARVARIKGLGVAMFNGCTFVEWDGKNRRDPAIEASGGNLMVTGCNFARTGPHIRLEQGIEGAVITGNRFVGPVAIENHSDAQVETAANLGGRLPKEEPGALVIDDTSGPARFQMEGDWPLGTGGGDYLGGTRWAFKGDGSCKATWRPSIAKAGRYAVYVWYGGDPANNHATDAPFVVRSADGEKTIRVNLRENVRRWNLLGEFTFAAGDAGCVMATNGANDNVVADAVKFVPVP